MTRLTVQYFAAFRDATGLGQESVEVDVRTPDELFGTLQARHPGLQRHAAMKVAVNDELVDWDVPLADGDTVLLFPPVAGG